MDEHKIEIGLKLNCENTHKNANKNLKEFIEEEEEVEDDDECIFKNEKDKINSEVYKSIISNQQKDTDEIIKEQIALSNINSAIYDYDNNYEQIAKKKENSILNGKINNNQPKYMEKIIKYSEKNNTEKLINIEKFQNRQIEKQTGKKIEEIPRFITNGYKERLKSLNFINNEQYLDEQNSNASKLLKNNDSVNDKDYFNQIFNENKAMYEKNISKNIDDHFINALTYKNKKDDQNNKISEKKIEESNPLSQKEGNKNPLEGKSSIEEYKNRFLQRKKLREENKKSYNDDMI